MSGFDLYIFFICLIVFAVFVALFITVITIISKQSIKLMRAGLEDERIEKELLKKSDKKESVALKIVDKIFSVIFLLLALSIFAFSLAVDNSSNNRVGDIPTIKVVMSSSMQERNEKNEYLFENNITNQIDTFDLVVLNKLPDEDSLKLYDVISYKIDDILVFHRIVAIEERNDNHPDYRLFTLQGDSNSNPDSKKVKYSQMIGIYNNQKIPFVGSFVLFMKSPAGYLCIILILFYFIATPIVDKKLKKEEELRKEVLEKKYLEICLTNGLKH